MSDFTRLVSKDFIFFIQSLHCIYIYMLLSKYNQLCNEAKLFIIIIIIFFVFLNKNKLFFFLHNLLSVCGGSKVALLKHTLRSVLWWFFRNHSNILICCSKNIYYYYYYYVGNSRVEFFRFLWWIEISEEQHLSEIEIFCNIINVFWSI